MSATKTERTIKGLLGTKLGMTQLWDANNRVVPVSVVQAGPCVVTQVRTPDVDGYSSVQLGFGAVKATRHPLPMCTTSVDSCYENRAGELGCVNPEFHELPVGEPTFKIVARVSA